jgi:5-methylcytosine-specific restriction endonuclease McrA
LSEFYKQKEHKDGLHSQCKACFAAYRADNREERAAYAVQYRDEHREDIAAYHAQYRDEHRDKRRAYTAAYDTEHKAERAAYNAQYIQTPQGKAASRAVWHRRRARKLGNGGAHTHQDIQRQGDSQKWKCWWRGSDCLVDCKDNYHVDHLIPLAKGGHNDPSNIVISCPHCNLSKHDKLPSEWIGRLF